MRSVFKITLVIMLLNACNSQNKPSPSALPTITPSATAQPITPAESPQATVTPPLDPGPYFTPLRPSPTAPENFTLPQQVGDFTLFQSNGSCSQRDGQYNAYRNTEQQVIYLQCRYVDNVVRANTELENARQILAGEPLFYKVQGEQSFLLGVSGNGFLYAWIHGAWFFSTRSLEGRAALDSFMQAFPY